jgi:hypothetical protein
VSRAIAKLGNCVVLIFLPSSERADDPAYKSNRGIPTVCLNPSAFGVMRVDACSAED